MLVIYVNLWFRRQFNKLQITTPFRPLGHPLDVDESGVFIPYFRFSVASYQVRPQGSSGVQRKCSLDLQHCPLGIMLSLSHLPWPLLPLHSLCFHHITIPFRKRRVCRASTPKPEKYQTVGKPCTWLVVRQPLAGLTGNGQHRGIRPAALASRSGNPSVPASWPASELATARRGRTPGREGTREPAPVPVTRHSGAGVPADPDA